jgi:hypothetical protein
MIMLPWEHPLPPILYKYLRPDRLHVLADARVRFSQRTAFEDDHELQPEYSAFGTVEEIKRHILRTPSAQIPGMSIDELAQRIASEPRHQAKAMETAIQNIKRINEMGILCLTVTASSERMWEEYADGGRGFVVAFDTAHIGFRKLTAPRGAGGVSYCDEAFETFLGMMENNVFEPLYRKRMKYSFEQEWRSIHLLKDLERCPGDIFLSSFDPASVREIFIRPYCAVEKDLRRFITSDARYQDIHLTLLDNKSLNKP